jgi:hypothetical protein
MILGKTQLIANINSELSDNSVGRISPYNIRHNLLDILDSIHLLTANVNLAALNFSTPLSNTTRVGEATIENLGLNGYSSIDNSAFGYAALRSNYQGTKNTAVGSNSLSCNVYGGDNVGVGYNSVGGNTTGYANIGVGNYTLNKNKIGNFNIAIGHGAGYYADRDSTSKLFIGSHPVDGDYICANPSGLGLVPLMYGDLSSIKLGVGTRTLHNYGTLQVSGDASPSSSGNFSLGHPLYPWKDLYISNLISFVSGITIQSSGSSLVVKSSIVPVSGNSYNLGSSVSKWNAGYFKNLFVDEAQVNKFKILDNYQYLSKTLFIAASGMNDFDTIDGGGATGLSDYEFQDPINNIYGYLSDENLVDAGLIIKASGTGYLRDYKFTYLPPDSSLTCLETDSVYSRSSWNSNISFQIASGNHLKTSRVIAYNALSLVSSGCYGLFLKNGRSYLSRENVLLSDPSLLTSPLAGIGSVNFLSNSGDSSNYIFNVSAIESGVTIAQRFLTGIKKREKDTLNSNKDKLNGFEIRYVDDSSNYIGGSLTDRLVIGSYNNSSSLVKALTLMKDNNEGLLCLTNIAPGVEDILPKTIFNIRTTGDATIRVSAENQGSVKSSIQLLGGNNCVADGFEVEYFNPSGWADLSMYRDSGKQSFIRLYENNTIGLFNSSGTNNAMVTIGDNFRTEAVVSMREATNTPSSTAKYGKIFVKQNIQDYQSQSLYLLDGSGNLFDLIINPYNTSDGRYTYTDVNANTFNGVLTPLSRKNLVSNNSNSNTSFGYKNLYSLTTGFCNSTFGALLSTGVTTGSRNTNFGHNSSNAVTSGYNNITIGNSIFNNTSAYANNNIIIGNNNIGNGVTSNTFMLGLSSSLVLLHGILGPTQSDKHLIMPSGGKFSIKDSTNTDSLSLQANIIEVVDKSGSDYPDNTLVLKFSGNSSANLMLFKNHVAPPVITPTYTSPVSPRPYAELNGDLRLLGDIRFNNNTSLNSASFLNDIVTNSGNISSLQTSFNNLIIEGYCLSEITAPSTGSLPTSGLLLTKNSSWQDGSSVWITNRDTTSTIPQGSYAVAIKVNNEYRPLWVSSPDALTTCC